MSPDPTSEVPLLPSFDRRRGLLLRMVRATRLLAVADAARYALHWLSTWPANRAFARTHPGFVTPPTRLAYDAYHHFHWPTYEASGRRHAELLAAMIEREATAGALVVLDWGAGPGRIIRHLRDACPSGRIGRLIGSDSNPRTNAWCRRHLAGLEFLDNEIGPPLPIPDGSCDVVYGYSVFTHLSGDSQVLWARELARILAPGGLLIFTTHGDRHQHLLSASERARYRSGEVAEQRGYREGKKWFLSVSPPAFVRQRLVPDFVDVRHVPASEDWAGQDLWTARRSPATST